VRHDEGNTLENTLSGMWVGTARRQRGTTKQDGDLVKLGPAISRPGTIVSSAPAGLKRGGKKKGGHNRAESHTRGCLKKKAEN